uniref:Uncharacterized protein n=1 Tax=Rhizoctonia solani TaxID=456999 RepID=N0A574_9AGAM|nr:hypothetical protein RSOL_m00690 [Rhizoctonia solani]AGK45397.1 hypothetical protein RSOL_m00690 [Rhizoctonia solani]
MLLISLMIPVVLLGIFPNVILDGLHLSVSTLLFNTTSIDPGTATVLLSSLVVIKPGKLTKEQQATFKLPE